ncbi:MAG TPA: hypothetical protein VMW54_06150 [Terriglobia bacterium]|nr:hypothetical protein [Terriglobia bacterium]
MNNTTKLRWFILLPGLAMWLGWGIRGEFGHSTGAMIPGAFLALALWILLPGKKFSRGLLIALSAVGFGFGGGMTTLESAGMAIGHYSYVPNATVLGYSGLVLKGALWALFGGAGLGVAFTASRYRLKDIILAGIFMAGSYYAGWALINRPKLLYFSVDRPESWGGLLFAAIVLLVWLTVRGHTRIPLVLALCAAASAAIGYPIAVTIHGYALYHHSGFWYHWWRVAETTFGTFMGVGLGLGTYFIKDELPDTQEVVRPIAGPLMGPWGIVFSVALAALCTALYQHDLPWIILGSFLWCAAYYSDQIAWYIGVAMTYYVTAARVVRYWLHNQHLGNPFILWTLVALATLVVSWKVTTWWRKTDKTTARNVLVFTVWAILTLDYLQNFINRAVLVASPHAVAAAGGRWPYTLWAWGDEMVVDAFFTVAAILLTWLAYRASRPRACE